MVEKESILSMIVLIVTCGLIMLAVAVLPELIERMFHPNMYRKERVKEIDIELFKKNKLINALEFIKEECRKHEECENCQFYSGYCLIRFEAPGNWKPEIMVD